MTNKKVIIEKFGAPEAIKVITDNHLPEPQPNEARIKIQASTVNSTDAVIRKGIYPLLKDKPPFTLGYDFVGIVDKRGANVKNLQIGQKVAALPQIGGNAEYICLPEKEIFTISSDADSAATVCLILAYMTAFQMLKHFAEVKSGDKILIHGGAGAVGNAMLQIGKNLGLEMVSTASADKLEFIESFGAKAVDYRSQNYEKELREAAGKGFDAAFDATNQTSFNQSFKLLKKGGKLVTFGTYSLAKNIEKKTAFNFVEFGLNFGLMMAKLKLWNLLPNGKSAAFFGIVDSKNKHRERFQADLNHLTELLKNGKIKPVIAKIFSLDKAKNAHELLEKGDVKGQIVLQIG